MEEQQDRKKRDTYKYSKGRKGTLKVPLGQVVILIKRKYSEFVNYKLIYLATMLWMEIPVIIGCYD